MTIGKSYCENQENKWEEAKTQAGTDKCQKGFAPGGSPLQATVTMRPQNLADHNPILLGQARLKTLTVKSSWGGSLSLSPVTLWKCPKSVTVLVKSHLLNVSPLLFMSYLVRPFLLHNPQKVRASLSLSLSALRGHQPHNPSGLAHGSPLRSPHYHWFKAIGKV